MLKLTTKQKTHHIGSISLGGQPGELPTVLVDNVFYKGMPEVTNQKEGIFNKTAVLKWIRLADTLSEKTGVPHLLDVMAMYPKAMCEYIAFISEQTSDPFSIDGANPETRIAALETVKQLGLEKNVVFNGITPDTSGEELSALKEAKVKTAIVMAYNELDYSPKGRVEVLAGSGGEGLLSIAEKAGIEQVLVDTVVFDVPSISYAAEAISLVKDEFGLPAGCSPANATYHWRDSLKDSVLSNSFAASNASAHSLAQWWGADFLIYGPIKQAGNMIPACALNDAIVAYYAMKHWKTKPLAKSHPLYRIF